MSRLDAILALPKITHNLVQGSPEWCAFRLEHDGSSEAAAMLGLSKKVKRTELMHQKHTGLPREFSDWLQKNVLDRGHEVEALARPHVEKLIGDDLYPVTCSRGRVSASCDGLTMDDRIAMEHKQWAEELAAFVAAGVLPDEHWPQCQQILLVTGAEKLYFVVSDGTPERMVYVVVEPDREQWKTLADGWHQFNEDRSAYVPPEPETPKPIGHAPETLPALRIEITGAVTASNLAEFKETALSAIRSVNRELSTDDHFADAEQAVKWCGEVESRIKAAKEHALSQTASIDALFKTLDDVSAEARRVRLDLEKLVERRKVEIKGELVADAKGKYDRHIDALRAECGAWRILPAPDFGAAIKGKRNVASIRDALDTTLANAKISADEQARTIRSALVALDDESKGFEHLFRDRLEFILLPPDVVRQMVRGRIAEHRAAEERRLEAERARIRQEEEARARAQAQREQQEREAAARQQQEAEARAQRQREEEAARAEQQIHPADRALEIGTSALLPPGAEQPVKRKDAEPPADNVLPMPTRAPAGPPTLTLGEIKKRLAPLSIDDAGLTALGFPPAGRDGAAKLRNESVWPAICDALIRHIQAARDERREAA